MANDTRADRYTTAYFTPGDTITRYVRSATGSDTNDGMTPATAWQTLPYGVSRIITLASVGQQQILDIGGGSVYSAAEFLNLGGLGTGGGDPSLDFTATGPDDYAYRTLVQLRADLEIVLTPINITGSAAEPTTGIRTVTVSNVLVAGAHVGQLLRGQGLGEGARIAANTANTITVTTNVNPATWTGPIGIYTRGAEVRYGDSADFTYDYATQLSSFCDWFIGGVAFTSNANAKGTALRVLPSGGNVFLQQCEFYGLILDSGVGQVFLDACDVHDGVFSINGASLTMRNTLVRDCSSLLCHGSGDSGLTELLLNIFDGNAGAWGGGNTESAFTFFAQNCQFLAATTDGVQMEFGTSRLKDCLVSNNAGDGVQVSKGANAILDNVQGTGNGGAGCRILHAGSQAERLNATAVTGAAGDVILGGAGTFAWGAAPQVDLGQLCRYF